MLETIILLAIYLVVGLAGLAVAGWCVATGQFLDIDGLFLTLACLSLAVVFLAAFALAVRKGEFAEAIALLRRPKPSPAKASAQAQPSGAASEVDESSRANAKPV